MEEGFRTVAYGDPTDPSNFQGPQINATQRAKILRYIEQGTEQGARVVVGGGRPAHLPTGYYVEPTLMADVDNSMTIAREEIFGPVLVVIPFDDDDDAVRIANDSPYGLGCGVTSGSEERAVRVARRIRAGSAMVNGGIWYGADAPSVGTRPVASDVRTVWRASSSTPRPRRSPEGCLRSRVRRRGQPSGDPEGSAFG